jgi:hypothetical protein
MRLLSRGKDEQEQAREHQVANADHQMNFSAAQQDDEIDAEYIDKMTGSQLSAGTVSILDNMLSTDWVLANFSEAEVNETRWLARTMMLRVEKLHPNSDSIWQGELRKYCSGDREQALPALDAKDRLVIFEFIQGTISRATRGRDGWQQDKFNESISVSERNDRGKDDKGGWMKR